MEYQPSEILCRMAATVDPMVGTVGDTRWMVWETERVRCYTVDGLSLMRKANEWPDSKQKPGKSDWLRMME